MCLESSGKPDAGKLARPVWGWGQGVIPWPTPHAGPAATAAARIDVHDWFGRMRPRDRRIAQALAVGGRTQEVAKRFRLSQGRVSQKRLEFYRDWEGFQSGTDSK